MSFHERLAQFLKTNRAENLSCSNANKSFRGSAQELSEVEELIRSFLPFDAFAQLQLPSIAYPRFARKLPRLYLKEDPSFFCLKEGFGDLSLLKRRALDKALWSLYAQKEMTGKVVLLNWVVPGGLGDYYAALESAQILKKNMPSLEIHLVVVLGAKEKFSHPSQELFSLHQLFYESKGECPSDFFWPKDLLELFASADLLLQIPVYFPPLSAALKLLAQTSSLLVDLVREYGFISSTWLSPPPLARSMGLHPLEMGIFLKEVSFDAKIFSSLLSRLHLFHNVDEPRSFFGYLVTEEGYEAFLHALLTYTQTDSRDIDLYVHQMAVYLMQFEKMKEDLVSYGISEVIFHTPSKTQTIRLSQKGKRLRVIHTGALSPEEFQTLLLFSEDFVACRGDLSFSEAISANKVYFYDGLLHAADFLKDLVALCDDYLPEYDATREYLRLFLKNMAHFWENDPREWVDEEFFEYKNDLTPKQIGKRMGALLKDPQMKKGMTKLNLLLKEKHDVSCHLTALVKRALVHKKIPSLAASEENLLLGVIGGKKTFSSMISELRCLLSHLKESVHAGI